MTARSRNPRPSGRGGSQRSARQSRQSKGQPAGGQFAAKIQTIDDLGALSHVDMGATSEDDMITDPEQVRISNALWTNPDLVAPPF